MNFELNTKTAMNDSEKEQQRRERGGGSGGGLWRGGGTNEGKELTARYDSAGEKDEWRAKEKEGKERWSRQKTERGEKKIQQHSSLSPSCPCHQSPGWQLPYSHTHTHTHTHTRHPARRPAYAADSPSDDSWRGMAWHSAAFVRGAVFLLY